MNGGFLLLLKKPGYSISLFPFLPLRIELKDLYLPKNIHSFSRQINSFCNIIYPQAVDNFCTVGMSFQKLFR